MLVEILKAGSDENAKSPKQSDPCDVTYSGTLRQLTTTLILIYIHILTLSRRKDNTYQYLLKEASTNTSYYLYYSYIRGGGAQF